MKIKITQGQRKQVKKFKELEVNDEFKTEIQNFLKKFTPGKKYSVEEYIADLLKIAEKYSLDVASLPIYIVSNSADVYRTENFDVCTIVNDYEDTKDASENRYLQTLYPVRIGISPIASKRDVKDFLDKRWHKIRDELNKFGKMKRFRTRKNETRDNFIWENREVEIYKLISLVNEKLSRSRTTLV